MSKELNKAPAFQFYYDRFNSSTALWTDEQVGRYLRLLMVQANNGFVTTKQISRVVPDNDEEVISKFDEISPGQFANKVLTGIILDRDAYRQSRSENRKKGTKNTKTYENHMSDICTSYDVHMVDVVVDKEKVKEKGEEGKRIAKEKPTPILELIPKHWPKENFLEVWSEHMVMRKRKKFAVTETIIKTRIAQLVVVSGGIWDEALKIALKSNERGYAEFFAPTFGGNSPQPQKGAIVTRDKA